MSEPSQVGAREGRPPEARDDGPPALEARSPSPETALAPAPILTAMADGPLSAERCAATALIAPGRGAVASFLGVVRDHAKGRGVAALRYECYRPMAEKVLARIAREAVERFGADLAIAATHGLGAMAPGDVSLALHAASAHRGPAFDAVRWLLEAIKRDLPVWKRQTFSDGEEEWVHGS